MSYDELWTILLKVLKRTYTFLRGKTRFCFFKRTLHSTRNYGSGSTANLFATRTSVFKYTSAYMIAYLYISCFLQIQRILFVRRHSRRNTRSMYRTSRTWDVLRNKRETTHIEREICRLLTIIVRLNCPGMAADQEKSKRQREFHFSIAKQKSTIDLVLLKGIHDVSRYLP